MIDNQEPVTVTLLPCPNPFGCSGSQPPVCTRYNFDGNSTLRHVVCHSCGFRGPIRSTEAEAITAWNTRLSSQSERDAVLEEAARVAEDCKSYEPFRAEVWNEAVNDIAAAIRALKTAPPSALEGEPYRMDGEEHAAMQSALLQSVTLRTPSPSLTREEIVAEVQGAREAIADGEEHEARKMLSSLLSRLKEQD